MSEELANLGVRKVKVTMDHDPEANKTVRTCTIACEVSELEALAISSRTQLKATWLCTLTVETLQTPLAAGDYPPASDGSVRDPNDPDVAQEDKLASVTG
jgi:hypothetical protein